MIQISHVSITNKPYRRYTRLFNSPSNLLTKRPTQGVVFIGGQNEGPELKGKGLLGTLHPKTAHAIYHVPRSSATRIKLMIPFVGTSKQHASSYAHVMYTGPKYQVKLPPFNATPHSKTGLQGEPEAKNIKYLHKTSVIRLMASFPCFFVHSAMYKYALCQNATTVIYTYIRNVYWTFSAVREHSMKKRAQSRREAFPHVSRACLLAASSQFYRVTFMDSLSMLPFM